MNFQRVLALNQTAVGKWRYLECGVPASWELARPQPPATVCGNDVKDENVKAVALYARVSTLDQNCDLQLADLRRYASQRSSRAYEYVDEGVSGTQRRRPALDNLLEDARKRRWLQILGKWVGTLSDTPTPQCCTNWGRISQCKKSFCATPTSKQP